MSILDELLRATKLQLPTRVRNEFWEKLVRALDDGSVVGDDAWDSLSDSAQAWANAGFRALTARQEHAAALSSGDRWDGDVESLKISPPVSAPKVRPKPDPTPRKRATGKKRAARRKATRGKQPEVTGRSAAFRSGHCYWFIRHMLEGVTSIDECHSEALLDRFAGRGVDLTPSSANMMMYDAITVLRVLRDLGVYDHPIVSEMRRTPAPDEG